MSRMAPSPNPASTIWVCFFLPSISININSPSAATRILAGWYLLHQDSPSYAHVSFNAFLPLDEATNEHIDVQDDHYKLVREMGAASVVLLKNVNSTLPLKKPRSLFMAGSDAGPSRIGANEFSDQVCFFFFLFWF